MSNQTQRSTRTTTQTITLPAPVAPLPQIQTITEIGRTLGTTVAPRTQFNQVAREQNSIIQERIAQNAIRSLINQLRSFNIEVNADMLNTQVEEDRALALAYLIIRDIRRIPSNHELTELQRSQIRAMEQRALLVLQGILGQEFPIDQFLRMVEIALLSDRLLNAGNAMIHAFHVTQIENQATILQETLGRINTARTTINGALNSFNDRRQTLLLEADRLQQQLLEQARQLVAIMDSTTSVQFDASLQTLRDIL